MNKMDMTIKRTVPYKNGLLKSRLADDVFQWINIAYKRGPDNKLHSIKILVTKEDA